MTKKKVKAVFYLKSFHIWPYLCKNKKPVRLSNHHKSTDSSIKKICNAQRSKHQKWTCDYVCRLISNNMILHMKSLNDIIIFSKIVWHSYVANFENCVVQLYIRHNTALFILLICRGYLQHNYISMCRYIILLNQFNNITSWYCIIFSL